MKQGQANLALAGLLPYRRARLLLFAIIASIPVSGAGQQLEESRLGNIDTTTLRAWSPSPDSWTEDELVLQMLHRVGQISEINGHQYVEASEALSSLDSDRVQLGQMYRVSGRVSRVERFAFDESQAELYGIRDLYVTTFSLGLATGIVEARVLSPRVPRAWFSISPIDEPFTADAVLVHGPDRDDRPWVWVASECRWFPESANSALGIGPSQLFLSRSGVNLGLADALVQRGARTSLDDRESRLMFQMFSAAESVDEETRPPQQAFDLIKLIKQPSRHFGAYGGFDGKLRRVSRVAVSSPQLREIHGYEDYFQLEVFVSLGQSALQIVDREGKPIDDATGEPLVYRNRLGVTVLSPSLPSGCELGDQNRPIRVEGFFLKNWDHYSERTRGLSEQVPKPTPLFVASRIDIRQPGDVPAVAVLNWLGGGVLALLLLAICGFALRSWRRDQQATPRWADAPPPNFDDWT